MFLMQMGQLHSLRRATHLGNTCWQFKTKLITQSNGLSPTDPTQSSSSCLEQGLQPADQQVVFLSLIFHFLLVSKSCFYFCLRAFINLIIHSTNIYGALNSVSNTMLTSRDTTVNKTDLRDPCLLICSPVWALIAISSALVQAFISQFSP